MIKATTLSLLSIIVFTGCQATGEKHRSSSYVLGDINKRQEAKTINIISITEAKVEIDNKEARKNMALVGGLIGSVAGSFIGHNQGETLTGGALGGIAGATSGLLPSKSVLVDAVTITYSEHNKIYTSTQIGLACEFKPGVALVVSTRTNETRVQPNANCKNN
ncbi:hypothetical protein [Candidatus Enterovibrio escicola]|uniref:Putative outer membrane lipoprotein n=1 Tax=Candidatus Enterovibrio escicola TaxID=1927127 RepID=A0A2A5T702_9GAMM|nr:hypothetical protein [Candidatus Enterovibrio escacola]PCS23989.1 putative outer membrane lipoprotein [Candidatus Enterovibrio escacola]